MPTRFEGFDFDDAALVERALERLHKDIEQEEQNWAGINRPEGPAPHWRMGDSEFIHHCIQEAITRILTHVLGVPESVCNMILKEVILQEMQTLRKQMKEVDKELLRRRITEGINPIIPPNADGKMN